MIAYATYQTFTTNHAVSLGASSMQLGYLFVALLVPSIVLSLLLNRYLLHRFDAKHLVVLGFFITALYCLLVPLTGTVPQLYMTQVLGGVGNTLTFSLLMGLCVQKIAAEKRGAAMGFYQAIYGIGMTTGPLIMGFLTDYTSLGIGFFIMAGISIASTLAAAVFLSKAKTSA